MKIISKGVIKCFGLLLALPIISGLSLSVYSEDTSALKYDLNKIPLYIPFIQDYPFQVNVTNSSRPSSADGIGQYVLSMTLDGTTCKGEGYVWIPYIYGFGPEYEIRWGAPGLDNNQWNRIGSPSNLSCQLVGPMTDYDELSVYHLSAGNPVLGNEFQSILPYRFGYDGFYRTDSRKSEGLDYDTKFDFHNVFGPDGYPDSIDAVYIPFGSGSASVMDSLTPGTPIEFSGEFIIDLDDPTSPFGLSPSTSVQLETDYFGNNEVTGQDFTSCTWSLDRVDSSDSTSPYSFKYSCPSVLRETTSNPATSFDDSTQFPYFRLAIYFDYSTNNKKFFQFIYDSSVSITNNDSTPGGSWDDPVVGNYKQNAPGSSTQNDYNPNYDSSLTSMFNFNFINPFAPIFQLFSNNSTCASIPTLASMLHSEETTVCPWFDSTTRDIVTPVLGLSSMMLVFGFTIRWLGSRSGNFVEDDTDGFDSGGIHSGRRGK